MEHDATSLAQKTVIIDMPACGHHLLLDVVVLKPPASQSAIGSVGVHSTTPALFGRVFQCYIQNGRCGYTVKQWLATGRGDQLCTPWAQQNESGFRWMPATDLGTYLQKLYELRLLMTNFAKNEFLDCVDYHAPGLSQRQKNLWAMRVKRAGAYPETGLTLQPGVLEDVSIYKR